MFAALAFEMWMVAPMDELARRLHREHRMNEHPDVMELTGVYGACRDGRRWRGRHWLTGPKAGTTDHVDLLSGSASAARRRHPVFRRSAQHRRDERLKILENVTTLIDTTSRS